jgi:hypothetical protein
LDDSRETDFKDDSDVKGNSNRRKEDVSIDISTPNNVEDTDNVSENRCHLR